MPPHVIQPFEPIATIARHAGHFTRLRRDLHAHPELCFEEQRTADLVARELAQWGIEVHRGLGRTGVVGVLKAGRGQRAIGLRADMDALPMTEHSHCAHASTHPGRMHACGHDGHVAMLLAAAQHLAHLAQHGEIDGTVVFIFQPAEEGGGGARAMIADGLFERFAIDAIFGLHNWPGLPAGCLAVCDGPVMASSNEFHITLTGKGTHAAMPHLGLDPVPAACQMVQAFQTIITRDRPPTDAAVLSVTMIHTGEATNVVPERCDIQGTVRTFTPATLDLIEQRMEAMTRHTAAAFDVQAQFALHRNYSPTINPPREAAFVRDVLRATVGTQNTAVFEPSMGAEDFSDYLLEKPGAYFVIGNGDGSHRGPDSGAGPCTLHNPHYDFNDTIIPLGATVWVRLAQRWLDQAA